MKDAKHKDKLNEPSHPSLFSISIFQTPQQFIALYLAIENLNHTCRIAAAKYLEQLLHRTKSAPIALTYTKEFLLLTTESQIQLTIIRFISQLSDLSAGKSMQSSLSFIIDNSSFLTELRHNLTHRVMVKGLVIQRGRQMILQQLKNKYWKVMFEKVWKIYSINEQLVQKLYAKITQTNENLTQHKESNWQDESKQEMKNSKVYQEYITKLTLQTESRLTPEYIFEKCESNYEFKSLIRPYIMKKLLPSVLNKLQHGQQDETIIGSYEIKESDFSEGLNLPSVNGLNNVRSMILMATMLEILLTMHKHRGQNQCSKYRRVLSGVIAILIRNIENRQQNHVENKKKTNKQSVLLVSVVMKKLRQIYLLKSIQEYGSVIENLPEEIVQNLQTFWVQKQSTLGKTICL